MGSHAKRRNLTHITRFTEVMCSGRLRWFGHVQRRDANNVTRRVMDQTMRTSQEDIAPTNQRRHDGRVRYPGRGPRPEGVPKKNKADPLVGYREKAIKETVKRESCKKMHLDFVLRVFQVLLSVLYTSFSFGHGHPRRPTFSRLHFIFLSQFFI